PGGDARLEPGPSCDRARELRPRVPGAVPQGDHARQARRLRDDLDDLPVLTLHPMRNPMNPLTKPITFLFLLTAVAVPGVRADDPAKPPAETKLAGPDGLSLVVRMQGPYDADVPLQVV